MFKCTFSLGNHLQGSAATFRTQELRDFWRALQDTGTKAIQTPVLFRTAAERSTNASRKVEAACMCRTNSSQILPDTSNPANWSILMAKRASCYKTFSPCHMAWPAVRSLWAVMLCMAWRAAPKAVPGPYNLNAQASPSYARRALHFPPVRRKGKKPKEGS